jgi:Raf kinase inhibitor-like YbhB/YbcL family protein
MSLKLTSTAFDEGGMIPDRYSHRGGNVSPPLAWTGAPKGVKGFALIVDDPDAPSGLFVHWLIYRMPEIRAELDEGIPAREELPDGARQGRNGFGEIGYGGPQPPSGTHRYFFHLYALDVELTLRAAANRQELDRAMRGHILAETQLMGRFRAK